MSCAVVLLGLLDQLNHSGVLFLLGEPSHKRRHEDHHDDHPNHRYERQHALVSPQDLRQLLIRLESSIDDTDGLPGLVLIPEEQLFLLVDFVLDELDLPLGLSQVDEDVLHFLFVFAYEFVPQFLERQLGLELGRAHLEGLLAEVDIGHGHLAHLELVLLQI